MEFQQEINERMRAILVDWLVEVHDKFKLTQETLYLAISILDRYLAVCEHTHVHTPLYQVFKRTNIFRSASVNDEFFLCAHCHCL